MSADIRVYREGYDTIFPADAPDPDSSLHGLIRNYVELYVDTGTPELVAYLPSQTTVLDLRRENLFYHYRPGDPTALAEEFGVFLELLHESDISGGGEDRSALARREGLPESIVGTGVFEEGWSLDKSEPSTQLALDFADAEPAFPGLSRLQREVVLDLLGEQRLVLGVEDFAAGLSAVQYLLGSDRDVRVAIATREDARALSTLDLVLVPGADRNFEPFDSESASALNDRTGEKIDNWTDELKTDGTEAVAALVGELERSNYAVYRDLRAVETRLRDGESVDVDSENAREVIAIEEEVETSDHLAAADRKAVSEAILDRIERAQRTVADRIRADYVPAMTDAIGSLRDREDRPFDLYDELRTASEIVATEYGHELTDLESQSPELETVRERWRELLVETDPEDPVREDIRTEIQGEIDSARGEIEEMLTSKATRILDTELRRLEDTHRGDPNRHITQLRAIGRMIRGASDGSDLPRQTRQKLDPIADFLASEEYDEQLCDNLHDRLATKLSGELLDVYKETVSDRVYEVYEQSSDPNAGLASLRDAIEDGEVDGRPRERPVKQAVELIRKADTDEFLREDDRTAFQNSIEGLVDNLAENRKREYTKEINSLVENLDADFVSMPEKRVQIYDEMAAIIDNDGSASRNYTAQARKFGKTWQRMLEDDVLSPTQKKDLIDETRRLLEQQQQRANRMLDSATGETDDSGFPSSFAVGPLEIPTLGILVLVLALVVAAAIFLVPSLPFLGSGAQPGVMLDSPDQGAQIETDQILVSGTTAASNVSVTFRSLAENTEKTERDVGVDQGSFEHEEGGLTVGSYLLTVSTAGNASQSTVFTYLGGPDTEVTIADIQIQAQNQERPAQSAGASENTTATATPTNDSTAQTGENTTTPTPTPTPTPAENRGYDVEITVEATGAVDRVAVALYDNKGERINRKVQNATGESTVTLRTDEAGVYIVEVSTPNVSADRLEDRRAIEVG